LRQKESGRGPINGVLTHGEAPAASMGFATKRCMDLCGFHGGELAIEDGFASQGGVGFGFVGLSVDRFLEFTGP
jgi:hypothetical protein